MVTSPNAVPSSLVNVMKVSGTACGKMPATVANSWRYLMPRLYAEKPPIDAPARTWASRSGRT